MKRAKKPVKTVPAPKMLKLIQGHPTRSDLSEEEFLSAVRDLRAAYRYRLERLMMSSSGSAEAAMVVALCDQVLLSPPDDIASSIAVRAAFRLGGLFSQDWIAKKWDTDGYGKDLANVKTIKDGGRNQLKLINRERALDPSRQAVQLMVAADPTIDRAKAQLGLRELGLEASSDAKVRRWIKEAKTSTR